MQVEGKHVASASPGSWHDAANLQDTTSFPVACEGGVSAADQTAQYTPFTDPSFNVSALARRLGEFAGLQPGETILGLFCIRTSVQSLDLQLTWRSLGPRGRLRLRRVDTLLVAPLPPF